MKRYPVFLVLLAVNGIFSTSTQAVVENLVCHVFGDPSKSTHTWTFDYDLQELAITDIIYELDLGPYAHITIVGSVDHDSTFSVVRTITNNTGVTWTAYILESGGTIVPGSAGFVPESAESTKLEAITYPERWIIEFWEPPPVLDGESFSVRFDMESNNTIHSEGSFDVLLMQNFIPEPTTIALFGLGGLALLRTRRARRAT